MEIEVALQGINIITCVLLIFWLLWIQYGVIFSAEVKAHWSA